MAGNGAEQMGEGNEMSAKHSDHVLSRTLGLFTVPLGWHPIPSTHMPLTHLPHGFTQMSPSQDASMTN